MSDIYELLTDFDSRFSEARTSEELDGDPLRSIATVALEEHADVHFAELFPGLPVQGVAIGGDFHLSTRLLNVLRRWRGREWTNYRSVTPAEAIQRRNLGRRSLGELLWLAYRASKAGFIGALESAEQGSDNGVSRDLSPVVAGGEQPARTNPLEPLQVVVAWARYERGEQDIRSALNLAATQDTLPVEVALAVSSLAKADLDEWVAPLRPTFDVTAAITRFWM